MNHILTTGGLRTLLLGITLLALAGCGRWAVVGRPFLLQEGPVARVMGIGLTIRPTDIVEGLDGSQKIGDGSVVLQVRVTGKEEREVYLEAEEQVTVHGYVIRFERVISDDREGRCELIVTRARD